MQHLKEQNEEEVKACTVFYCFKIEIEFYSKINNQLKLMEVFQ
jgi:hypothetical protein